jgi:uncharacterized protein (TIGR00369 family)
MTANSRKVSASRTTISQLMNPQDANLSGNVHGGHIMKLVDEAGALACMRHSRKRVVTVAVDQLTFREPIYIGDLITIVSEVSYVGRSSMEAEVSVYAEDPQSGVRRHTNTAYLVYVALSDRGHPEEVPALETETEEQSQRLKEGKIRQQNRLERATKNRGLDS